MNNVLEFPSKIFFQWGAIAQEIVPYLAQGGANKEEIRAIVDRLRIRWEQQETPPAAHDAGVELSRRCDDDEATEELEARDLYVSRHWKSQPARTLIRFAMADFQRNTSC